MAYTTTPKASTTTLSAGVATKVPATAQASRNLLKLYNEDSTNVAYYGDSSVTTSTGIPIPPGGESDWIYCSGDIYVICATTGPIRSLEMA